MWSLTNEVLQEALGVLVFSWCQKAVLLSAAQSFSYRFRGGLLCLPVPFLTRTQLSAV